MSAIGLARGVRWLARWTAVAVVLTAAGYGGFVAVAWLRYGKPTPPSGDEADAGLDRFMPVSDIVERHQIEVDAPVGLTFAAASEMDLYASWPVRLIFGARERVMGAGANAVTSHEPFLSSMKAMGWGVLMERPGQEIVMGAVTQPWLADVVFRPLGPEQFARFNEPGYVKIAWTLRAEPRGASRSTFHTETRAVATDAVARGKFRRYWSLASPGITLIRRVMLQPLKADAERRARALR